ncbi:hypothetical protein J3R83DRAFT_6845 [Lanmaoa asiatica]|nr:hypothetical protein J3R83DRAFT_6845 [Lanmaoa asiatica]
MSATPEEKIDYIVRNTSCVLRIGEIIPESISSSSTYPYIPIVPTRNTSYTHLRDGFVRALTARLQLAKSRRTLSAETEVAVQSPLRKLKSIFPTTKLAKVIPSMCTSPHPLETQRTLGT